eukprot:g5382.t1
MAASASNTGTLLVVGAGAAVALGASVVLVDRRQQRQRRAQQLETWEQQLARQERAMQAAQGALAQAQPRALADAVEQLDRIEKSAKVLQRKLARASSAAAAAAGGAALESWPLLSADAPGGAARRGELQARAQLLLEQGVAPARALVLAQRRLLAVDSKHAKTLGYYHFDSKGNKFQNKWDSFDVEAELRKVDEDEERRAAHKRALGLGEALERVLMDDVDTLRGDSAVVAKRKLLAATVSDTLLPRVDRVKAQLQRLVGPKPS